MAVIGLQVLIQDSRQGTVTDPQGNFRLLEMAPGSYTLVLDHIAYKEKSLPDVRVRAGHITSLDTIVIEAGFLDLRRIVVTATRGAHRISDISNAVTLVPFQKLDIRMPETTAEALREETGIFVQKTSHGGGSAKIRGFDSNQILLLVDGIRLNNSTYRLGNHPYLTTVDAAMLENLEVVRGPTSVLYGSDAMGGTINARTHQVGFSRNMAFGYRFLGRIASADQQQTGRAGISFSSPFLTFTGGFTAQNFGDLRRGANSSHSVLENSTNGIIQTPTGFSSRDLDAKLRCRLSDKHYLTLAGQMTRRGNIPRYDKYETSDYYRWLYTPQDRDLLYLRYQYLAVSPWLNSLEVTLSRQLQREGREIQKSIADILTRELDEVITWGMQLEARTRRGKHRFSSGLDLYLDDVHCKRQFIEVSGAETEDFQGRYPDGSGYASLGLYLQDEIHLSPLWSAITGLRLSSFQARFDLPSLEGGMNLETFRQNFIALTGSLGLIRKITDALYLNANLAQAFRAPNLSDLTKLGESKGDIFEVPNKDLEAEELISLDLGIKFAGTLLSGSASVYYSFVEDLIASADALYQGSATLERQGVIYRVKSKQNTGQARVAGVETECRLQLNEELRLQANFTSTYAQNITLDEPVGGVAPAFGTAGLHWRRRGLSAALFSRFAARQSRLSSDDLDDSRIPPGGTPGWQTLNLRGALPISGRMRLIAAIENIFDVNYREHGSGINGPGRNIVVSLELNRL